MARKETQKLGSIPLQTIDANIQYAKVSAKTTYGIIGIKIWIYLGKYGEEITPVKRQMKGGRRGGGRRPSGGGRRQFTVEMFELILELSLQEMNNGVDA